MKEAFIVFAERSSQKNNPFEYISEKHKNRFNQIQIKDKSINLQDF